MKQHIITVMDDQISDLIEAMLATRPNTYDVLKAASLTEAWAWLAIAEPSRIHLIVLGLSQHENSAFVNQLEESYTRNDYNIVIMQLVSEANRQAGELKANGVLIQPIRRQDLFSVLESFESHGVSVHI